MGRELLAVLCRIFLWFSKEHEVPMRTGQVE